MSLTEEVELLRTVPIFAKVEPAKLKLIAFTSERLTFEVGQEVCHQGDAGDAMYVILSGSVRITKRGDDGTEVEVLTEGAGDHFGDLALLDGGTRSASVTALTECDLFLLRRDVFLAALQASPPLLTAVLANLTQDVRETTERVVREEMQRRTLAADMELAKLRSLTQMVAGVAHEINTPLGIVRTAVSIVRSRLSSPLIRPT